MSGTARKTANVVIEHKRRQSRSSGSLTLLSNGKAPRPRRHIPNSRANWTAYLDAEKGLGLIEGAVHAAKINRPLNLSVTIHFERASLSDLWRPQDAVGAWLKRAGQWLGLRAIPCTFLWVMEHAVGTGRHVHILLHCPPAHQKAFKEKGRGDWLRKAGMIPIKHAIHYERVGPRGYDPATATTAQRGTYLRQLQGSLRYHIKGLDPDQRIDLGVGPKLITELLGIEPEYSSPIYGRRVSRSQNIGRTAIERYHAQRHEEAQKGLSGGMEG